MTFASTTQFYVFSFQALLDTRTSRSGWRSDECFGGRNKDHYAVTLVDKMREHIEHKDPVLDGAKAT